MPTFISHGLTVTVGEMSRAAALSCARDFNALIGLYPDDASLLAELEVLCVIHAPAVAKTDAGIVSGTQKIDDFELTIPITREAFDKLPFTLTRSWIEAAVNANEWIVIDLKNVLSRIMPSVAEPLSGSGQSSEPTKEPPTTTTIGVGNIPIG